MPRRSRIHLAGMPLHIVQRGHNRDACFFGDDDYTAYRHWLGEALKTTGCQLHAYVQPCRVGTFFVPTRLAHGLQKIAE